MVKAKVFTETDIQEAVNTAKLAIQVEGLKTAVENLTKAINENYVTKDQFAPIKALVYGFAGLVLIQFVSVLVYIVFHLPR